jgi:hypothetical protein
LQALQRDFIALKESPDTRRSTPWLFRLQAYLIEFMAEFMWRVGIVRIISEIEMREKRVGRKEEKPNCKGLNETPLKN